VSASSQFSASVSAEDSEALFNVSARRLTWRVRRYDRAEGESWLRVLFLIERNVLSYGVVHDVPCAALVGRGQRPSGPRGSSSYPGSWHLAYCERYDHTTRDAHLDARVPADARYVFVGAVRLAPAEAADSAADSAAEAAAGEDDLGLDWGAGDSIARSLPGFGVPKEVPGYARDMRWGGGEAGLRVTDSFRADVFVENGPNPLVAVHRDTPAPEGEASSPRRQSESSESGAPFFPASTEVFRSSVDDRRSKQLRARLRRSFVSIGALATRATALKTTVHDEPAFPQLSVCENSEEGVFWYRWDNSAFGFTAHPEVQLWLADSRIIREGEAREKLPGSRLSWNLDPGQSTGGWRAGRVLELGENPGLWYKCLWYRM